MQRFVCILFVVDCGFGVIQKLDFVYVDLLFVDNGDVVLADAAIFVAYKQFLCMAF